MGSVAASAGPDIRLAVAVLSTLAGAAADALSHGIYRLLIIPRLPELYAVPDAWWLGMLSPYLVSAAIIGLIVRTRDELWVCAGGAAVGCVLSGAAWSLAEPHAFAGDDPASWLVSGLMMMVAWAVAGGCVFLARRGLSRILRAA